MTNHLKLLILLLAVGILFVIPVSSASALTTTELVAKIQAAYRARTDITVDFRQVIKKPATGRKIKARGTIYFKNPDRFYWHQKRPDRLHYISDGKVFWKYQPNQSSAEKFLLKSTQLFHTIRLFFGKGDLAKNHSLALGKPMPDGRLTLVLTPKDQRIYKKITLVIDPKTYQISESWLVDPDDNLNEIRYRKLRFDPIPIEKFAFKPGVGVNIRDFTKPRTPVKKK